MKQLLFCLAGVVLVVSSGMAAFAGPDDKPMNAILVTVPNLYGRSLSEAITILNNAGLNRETQLSDRDGERRIVIRQSPAAGSRVPLGSIVKIFGQLDPDIKR
jgi:beta-lactam-binding protein with PASTA domain